MISLHEKDSQIFSPIDTATTPSNMSSQVAGQSKLDYRPTNYTMCEGSGNDNDHAGNIAGASDFLFLGDRIESGAWNTDSWSHETSYSDAEFDQSLDTGAPPMFASTPNSKYPQTHPYTPPYSGMTSQATEITKSDDTMPTVDRVDDPVATSAMHNESQGSQPGENCAGELMNTKLEETIDGSQSVSFTPSCSGEYDEYDGSEFGGSRAQNTPKINKDGGVRKPRQPRAKLLKWSDNDWKNVVLGIIWACSETGVQIPFDQAAQIVGESCTAGALQQAVLKLRQKQVAEGNFIPSLRMAWTRKSKNSGSMVSIADDPKITPDTAKVKTMLPKKKPTRFSGNQTFLITLKRAYMETARAHLDFPHTVPPKIVEEPGTTAIHKDYEAIYPLGDNGNAYADPYMPHTPMQKRRTNYRVSLEGSPLPTQDLYIDMSKIRDSNRKARVHDGTLYQNFITTSSNNEDLIATMSTPPLTVDSGFCTQLGTPTTNVSPGRGHVMASNGPISWTELSQVTPPNTIMANNSIASNMESMAQNPQGMQQYEFATGDDFLYHHQGARYNMARNNAMMQAPSFGNAGFVGANSNLGFVTTAFEDPFWDE